MSVFLRFRHGKRGHPGIAQIIADRAVDLRRGHQIIPGDVEVTVIFHHPGKKNLRETLPFKFMEILLIKGAGNFNGAIPRKL